MSRMLYGKDEKGTRKALLGGQEQKCVLPDGNRGQET